MRLELIRDTLSEGWTLGQLYLDGKFECFTVEDKVRPLEEKIPGKTAVPAGRYEVQITWSPRFQRMLPLLLAVPGFAGVRIHPGNTAADTEGCILPGRSRDIQAGVVRESRVAFDALFAKLQKAEDAIWLEIKEGS